MTEYLAHDALGAVALHGAADLARRRNPKPCRARRALLREQRHKPAVAPESGLINQLEVGPLPNVLGGPEGSHLLLVRNRQALSTFGAATLQHLAAVLGRHAHQESVALGAAAGIGLKRSLALLGSGHSSPLVEPPIIDGPASARTTTLRASARSRRSGPAAKTEPGIPRTAFRRYLGGILRITFFWIPAAGSRFPVLKLLPPG